MVLFCHQFVISFVIVFDVGPNTARPRSVWPLVLIAILRPIRVVTLGLGRDTLRKFDVAQETTVTNRWYRALLRATGFKDQRWKSQRFK